MQISATDLEGGADNKELYTWARLTDGALGWEYGFRNFPRPFSVEPAAGLPGLRRGRIRGIMIAGPAGVFRRAAHFWSPLWPS